MVNVHAYASEYTRAAQVSMAALKGPLRTYVMKVGVAMVSMLIFDLKNWNRF